jgi:putative membrane protein
MTPAPDGSSSPRLLVALLVGWAVLAASFAVTSWLLSGMAVSGGVWGYIWLSAVFGIVNAILGTILRILTFPLTLLTLGLFSVIVNAILLSVTDALSSRLTIDEFWWTAIWAAIILGVVSVVLELLVRILLWREPQYTTSLDSRS